MKGGATTAQCLIAKGFVFFSYFTQLLVPVHEAQYKVHLHSRQNDMDMTKT